MSKLLENLYRSVNIGLINELKIICEYLKVDIFKVIELASTKILDFKNFYLVRLGGHCIPIDPYYLSWISKKKRLYTKIYSISRKNKYPNAYVGCKENDKKHKVKIQKS